MKTNVNEIVRHNIQNYLKGDVESWNNIVFNLATRLSALINLDEELSYDIKERYYLELSEIY
ncbi:MAG: hypothetical protein R6W78_01110 [Bacteroidales bacterium]